MFNDFFGKLVALTPGPAVKRVQTHTMTIYTEAKINRKMAPNWP